MDVKQSYTFVQNSINETICFVVVHINQIKKQNEHTIHGWRMETIFEVGSALRFHLKICPIVNRRCGKCLHVPYTWSHVYPFIIQPKFVGKLLSVNLKWKSIELITLISKNCVQLVEQCLDYDKLKMSNNQISGSIICSAINNRMMEIGNSSTILNDCIDIEHYMMEATDSTYPKNVCHRNQCLRNQRCVRSQECSWNNCPRYRCLNQCTIGKLAELVIPSNTFVSIANVDRQNGWNNCYNQCFCSDEGNRLVDCLFYCQNDHLIKKISAVLNEETKRHLWVGTIDKVFSGVMVIFFTVNVS